MRGWKRTHYIEQDGFAAATYENRDTNEMVIAFRSLLTITIPRQLAEQDVESIPGYKRQ